MASTGAADADFSRFLPVSRGGPVTPIVRLRLRDLSRDGNRKMAKTQEKDLRAFLELFGEIDESIVEFTDVPDLLARCDGYTLGVEHTRIYVNDPTLTSGRQRKPQELIQQEIIDKAHALFRQESSIPLWLTVTFEEPFNHRSGEVDDIASGACRGRQSRCN